MRGEPIMGTFFGYRLNTLVTTLRHVRPSHARLHKVIKVPLNTTSQCRNLGHRRLAETKRTSLKEGLEAGHNVCHHCFPGVPYSVLVTTNSNVFHTRDRNCGVRVSHPDMLISPEKAFRNGLRPCQRCNWKIDADTRAA